MDAGVEGVAGVQVCSITCPDALGKAWSARMWVVAVSRSQG